MAWFPVTAIAPCLMFGHHTVHKFELVHLNVTVGCIQWFSKKTTRRCGRAVGVSTPPLAWPQHSVARAGTCPCPPERGWSVAATRSAAAAAPPQRQRKTGWVETDPGEDIQGSRAANRGRERDEARPHALRTRPPPAQDHAIFPRQNACQSDEWN